MAKKNKRKWQNRSKQGNQQEKANQNTEGKNKTSDPRERVLPEIKLEDFTCSFCQKEIQDLPSALSDKTSGEPVHFDCVLEHLKESEEIGENEKLFYIGKGNFAIAYFENPHDLRKFEIRKLIEWENKEKESRWRNDISDLYSLVE
ncbi:MAG TPA: hypothetical protein PK248_04460 [Treponemataceae bacterium]|nr:hypothetical protein [Treponemataceae bacterium]HPM06752.1 hypothetical protein [Treponemataceae bacterium]